MINDEYCGLVCVKEAVQTNFFSGTLALQKSDAPALSHGGRPLHILLAPLQEALAPFTC